MDSDEVRKFATVAIPGPLETNKLIFKTNKMNTQTISRFVPVVKKFPNLNLIFAHAGLEQNDEFIELMKQYPSTSKDISTQTATNIGKMIHKLGAHRLMFGSDYPFFNQAFPILSVLRATQNKEFTQMIFADNAKRAMGLSS